MQMSAWDMTSFLRALPSSAAHLIRIETTRLSVCSLDVGIKTCPIALDFFYYFSPIRLLSRHYKPVLDWGKTHCHPVSSSWPFPYKEVLSLFLFQTASSANNVAMEHNQMPFFFHVLPYYSASRSGRNQLLLAVLFSSNYIFFTFSYTYKVQELDWDVTSCFRVLPIQQHIFCLLCHRSIFLWK